MRERGQAQKERSTRGAATSGLEVRNSGHAIASRRRSGTANINKTSGHDGHKAAQGPGHKTHLPMYS